jgi:hypothetical protein
MILDLQVGDINLTPPVSGSYTTTTIGAINSTGVLTAVIDGPNHVSVRAVNPIDMYGWIESRPTAETAPHPYTTLLRSISVKP